MFTVKYIDNNGDETLYPNILSVKNYNGDRRQDATHPLNGVELKYAEHCVHFFERDTKRTTGSPNTNVVYVMNDHGKTVSTYYL